MIVLFLTTVLLAGITSSVFASTTIENRYKVDDSNYLIGVFSNTTVGTLKQELSKEGEIILTNNSGEPLSDDDIITTGTKLNKNDLTYTLVVCGDINSDGNITTTDLIKLKHGLIEQENLFNEKETACDLNLNGTTTITDLIYLKKVIVKLLSEEELYFNEDSNDDFEYKHNKLTDKITITGIKTDSKTVQIPETINELTVLDIDGPLAENTSCEKIVLPAGQVEIKNGAFINFSSLQEFEVDENNPNFCADNGILYSKNKEELIFYPRAKTESEYIVDKTVKIISDYAFENNTNLKKIYLLNTIETINSNAFEQTQSEIIVQDGALIAEKFDEINVVYSIDKKPELKSLKIINPASGEHDAGVNIVIRAQFSENISGKAPELKIKFDGIVGTGSIKVSRVDGSKNYIDYTYTTTNEHGLVTFSQYSGGNLVDKLGSKASISLKKNTGNNVTILYQTRFGPYQYSVTGTNKGSYKDDSIEVSVERIDSMNVAKIWIKDPSKQIKKAEAGWNVKNKIVKDILSGIPNAIIGCNGSFFYDDGSNWKPSSTTDVGKSNWQYTIEGHSVISNGVIRRNFGHANLYSAVVMGIDKNGQLMCNNIRNLTASQMVSSYNIVNTFSGSTIFIENGKETNENSRSGNDKQYGRTLIGQVNYNNYILICSFCTFDKAIRIAKSLDCQFLFGLDGGGSSAMVFRNNYVYYNSVRKVQDVIYFSTLE
ncbi:MAG: phosphodiester glycosidase family protein [Clostridia bacterium]|nr:phosphodiester glycosidase family protein [Clostridia bacterium]